MGTGRRSPPPLAATAAPRSFALCTHAPPSSPTAGQTISHIKEVPGWSERLASDSEAVVKAEHEVRVPCLQRIRCGMYGSYWQRAGLAGHACSALKGLAPVFLTEPGLRSKEMEAAAFSPSPRTSGSLCCPPACAPQCADCPVEEMQKQTIETLKASGRARAADAAGRLLCCRAACALAVCPWGHGGHRQCCHAAGATARQAAQPTCSFHAPLPIRRRRRRLMPWRLAATHRRPALWATPEAPSVSLMPPVERGRSGAAAGQP